MIYQIEDEISNRLEAIRLVAPELAREQMSKAGEKVKTAMRDNMQKHRHNWFSKRDKDGNLYLYQQKGRTVILGSRKDSKGNELSNPPSMANLITNYFDEKNGLVVVGGTHRGFRPIKRENGKVTGTLKYVKGIGKHQKAILQKLNSGDASAKNYGWWHKGKLNTLKDEPEMQKRKFRKYGFMDEGISSTSSAVNNLITSEYEKMFMQTMQREKVKVRKIV